MLAMIAIAGSGRLRENPYVDRGAFTRAFGWRLPLASALQAVMEMRHERRPHWYVQAVGVRPEHWGRGLGTALLAPTLERCDREGLPAYLEASSERSAALYERLGFEHVRELRFAGSRCCG